MRLTIVTILILVVGCATNSGVVEMGPDSYMISKQAGSGFAGLGTMKVDSIREAGAFCKEHGKILQVTATQDDTGFGKFPHSDVQFMCLAEGDPRLKGTVMVPVSPAPVDKVMNGN